MRLLGVAAAAWLAAALACSGGCGSDKSSGSNGAGPSAEGGAANPGTPGQAASQTDPSGKAKPAATGARGVLDAMAAAYKAAPSYADAGTVRLYAKRGAEVLVDQKADLAVAFVRPNKIRLQAYLATAVCDGKQFWAFIQNLPGQVVGRPAPQTLTLESLFADPVLTGGLSGRYGIQSPALMLLLLKDPVGELLGGSQEPVLLAPESIGEDVCDRVQITRKEDNAVPAADPKYRAGVLWIDQKARVLRRAEFPVDRIAFELAGGQKLDTIWMVADFVGARLGGQVDPVAFAFEAPKGVRPEEMFIPADPHQLLGKPVPPFAFVDLDGKPVTPASLGGQVALVVFWGMNCKFCLEELPELEKVYQKYKDKVVFLGVNVDQAADFDNDALGKRFESLKVTIPLVRDTQAQLVRLFVMDSVPAWYLVGADGRVQEFHLGRDLNLAVDLPARLDKLLAGKDLCREEVENYQRYMEGYRESVKQRLEGKAPEEPLAEQKVIPPAKIAPRSEPQKLKLTPLWKYADLQKPGNVLVAPGPGGTPRILVLDASRFHSVVELGPDGKLVATHVLPIKGDELVMVLTTAAGADGKRYFTGTAIGQQRVHLFDESFKLLTSYPQDALENRHPGIWDAQLADLDGDGTLELYVGYWAPLGVQGATLDGRRKWSYRRIASVMRLAVGGPDAKGQRLLWCTHNRGTLVALDAAGNPQGELAIAKRPIHSIFAADLTGDGRPEWCGLLSVDDVGRTVAIGLNLQGEALWTYEIPKGVHRMPVEPVVPGQVFRSGPGQWLLPGPDGSIHILGADGKLIDRFNYGAPIHGLATATLGGRPALIVTTPNSVEAWGVE